MDWDSDLGAFARQELGAQTSASSSCVFCKVPFKDMVLRAGRRYEVKVLHCLHSACGRCLEDILKTGQEALCPMCDHRTKELDYHKYLCNFAENQTLDYRAVGGDTPLITCDECVDAGPAVQYCAQCVRRLCAECSEHHRRSKASASHTLTALEAMALKAESVEHSEHSLHRAAMCSSHPNRELEFFCEGCNIMCCRECIRESHENHIYKLPSGALVERQRQGLSEHAQQLRGLGASLQDRHQSLTESIRGFEAELIASLQNIRGLETQVKRTLQERRRQMLGEVEAFHAQQQEAHEARRASLASTMLTRWRAIDFLEKVLARGTNCEVLLLTGYISAQQLLGEDVLASKVAELAICAALHPKQLPVKWSGDVAAVAHEISQMAAVTEGARSHELPGLEPEKEEEPALPKIAEVQPQPEWAPVSKECCPEPPPERLPEEKPREERRRISLLEAMQPRTICLSQALDSAEKPTQRGNGAKKARIRRLGGATVQGFSDQEIRESGLGELRAVLGLEGDELGCFRSPCGMAVDSTRLYVADTLNHRIQIFDKFTLEALGILRLPAGATSLSDPSGMCCLEADGTTVLVVVEYTLDRVLKIELSTTGEFEPGSVPAVAVRELAPGTFYGPFGAGISQGRVVVADSCNHRCLVLTLSGQVLFEFGCRGQGLGQFEYPECVATFQDGHVAVSDKDNHRIQVFDSHGRFQHLIPRDWAPLSAVAGRPGSRPVRAGALSGPMGMCVDTKDRLFVCDCGSDRVQIFSRQGDFLWSSCSAASSGVYFRSPTAMAADDQGLVYVASDHCVQIF